MHHRKNGIHRRLLCLLLALALLTAPALAAAEELSGHWAGTELEWALDQGLITGDDTGALAPDQAVSGAQAATILARLLDLREPGTYPGAENSWYAQAAGLAYAAGILPAGLDLTQPLTRAQSWELLAAAFGLTRAAAEEDLLEGYSDLDTLTPAQRRAAAALLQAGALTGYEGKLTPQDTLTRAQFVVLLYRLTHRQGLEMRTDSQAALADVQTEGELLFAGGVNRIELSRVQADTITVTSAYLDALILSDAGADTLALLQQKGGVHMSCEGVNNLILGSARGTYSNGTMDQVQITGTGAELSFEGFSIKTLTVSGSNNTITLDSACRIETLVFTSDSSGNRLRLSGQTQLAYLDGQDNELTGVGSAGIVNLLEGGNCLGLQYTVCNDLIPVQSAPEPEPEPEPVSNLPQVTDRETMAALRATVSGTYQGNYTEADNWDYDTATKEAFVNHCGYTSRTDYLIWVSRASQKVNIFTRGQGDLWVLDRTYRCGTGAYGTPEGVTYVFGKQTGWFTATYDVHYVLNFYPNTGYAFHSRLYYPGSDQLSDPAIGYPVSHGCVRMYTEDVQWMWENIPIYTTVVIY